MKLSIYVLLLNLTTFCVSESDLGQVIFANILFRHGDRTPNRPYPNDPYRNESSWPVPFGHLTKMGKYQLLALGKWLRNRYAELLPKTYSVNDIYVRSTDIDRALMSAGACLAGLYPPYGNQVWDIEEWMPIPVHTVALEEDVFYDEKFCAKYEDEISKVFNSTEFKEIERNNSELYQYFSKHTGLSDVSMETIASLYGTLFAQEQHNKSLPEWTKSVYPEKVEALANKYSNFYTHNKILQRLNSGPLLKEMIAHMVEKSKKTLTPDRKLWIYSAHDTTIISLLRTLNLFKTFSRPPYAATVLIELRVKALEHVVTISYKNSTGEPHLLTLPGCTPACPLDQFITLTKDVVPENWETECNML